MLIDLLLLGMINEVGMNWTCVHKEDICIVNHQVGMVAFVRSVQWRLLHTIQNKNHSTLNAQLITHTCTPTHTHTCTPTHTCLHSEHTCIYAFTHKDTYLHAYTQTHPYNGGAGGPKFFTEYIHRNVSF